MSPVRRHICSWKGLYLAHKTKTTEQEDLYMGPFDRMFDRNGDGHLDAFERAMQMDFIDYVNNDGIYKDNTSTDSFDDFDSDYDDFDSFGSDDF